VPSVPFLFARLSQYEPVPSKAPPYAPTKPFFPTTQGKLARIPFHLPSVTGASAQPNIAAGPTFQPTTTTGSSVAFA